MEQSSSAALFRLSVLGPLASRQALGRGELTKIIGDVARQQYTIPHSRKRHVSAKTIESWYYAWRREGIKGLEPKIRIDRGQSKLPPDVQAAIVSTKRANPKFSVTQIIGRLEENGRVPDGIVSKSAVHRLLQAHHISHHVSLPEKQIEIQREIFNEFFGDISSQISSRVDILRSFRWLLDLLQCKYNQVELKKELGETITEKEIGQLLHNIREGPLVLRNRAVTILGHIRKISNLEIAQFLAITTKQVEYTQKLFGDSGMIGLFGPKVKRPRKFDDTKCKDAVFALLHSPPKSHNVNRTTWTLRTLSRVLAESGLPIGIGTIATIIKDAGFKFRKAKKVLTSTDPEYKAKLREITNILANLKPDEKFFSVDEYGPFSIKMQGGKSLVKADQLKIVPQYQKSKGSLIVTAALELCENQITHFYSKSKNTIEMMKLIEILIGKYSGQSRIYFSWDAASWHASKKLRDWLDEINSASYRAANKTPLVTLAPLPASAQFLNVIESVFSGMARAIIHNSNYQSVDECRDAIDRYFVERNAHFKSCPSRAGNKIWGKERVICKFSESSNCKDPLYR